jgi:hypothetical protein
LQGEEFALFVRHGLAVQLQQRRERNDDFAAKRWGLRNWVMTQPERSKSSHASTSVPVPDLHQQRQEHLAESFERTAHVLQCNTGGGGSGGSSSSSISSSEEQQQQQQQQQQQ